MRCIGINSTITVAKKDFLLAQELNHVTRNKQTRSNRRDNSMGNSYLGNITWKHDYKLGNT